MEDRSRAQHPRRRSLHPIHRLRPRRRRARRGGVQDGGRYRRRPRHCDRRRNKGLPFAHRSDRRHSGARHKRRALRQDPRGARVLGLEHQLAGAVAHCNGCRGQQRHQGERRADGRSLRRLARGSDLARRRQYLAPDLLDDHSGTNRIYTLMHDPQYRLAIAWQNVGYNQPSHPSFYLGEGMNDPPRPRIVHRDTEAPAFKTLTPSATRRPARRGSDSADHRCLERPSG